MKHQSSCIVCNFVSIKHLSIQIALKFKLFFQKKNMKASMYLFVFNFTLFNLIRKTETIAAIEFITKAFDALSKFHLL